MQPIKETTFCACGLQVNFFGECPRHKKQIIKVKKQVMRKCSGKSKTPYGKYEDR